MSGGEIARLWATIGADTSGFKREMKQVKTDLTGVQSTMGSMLSTVGKIGGSMAAAFGAKEIISNTVKFDKQLTNIMSLGGRTKEEMAALGKEINKMGSTTFLEGGSQSAINAFYDVAGGIQGSKKQMDVFTTSIYTAEAGMADLMATTKGVVSFTNAYGLESAKDIGNVGNMLTRVVGLGVGEMTEMVSAMAPIAGISSQLGVNMNELGAGMAFITTKGETAGAAATQLQSTMSALLTPNTKMLKMYKKLGISSGQWAIKNFGLVGTLKKLKEAAGGSEQEMGEMLGRIEAVKGSMLLTGTDFAGFKKTFDTGLGSALETAGEIQAQSFAAKWQKFQNQIGGLGITVGQTFLPVLSNFADGLSNVASALSTASPEVLNLITIVTGATLVAPTLKSIADGFSFLTGALKPLILPAVVVGGLFAAYQNNWGGFRDRVDELGKAFDGLPQPVREAAGAFLALSIPLIPMAAKGLMHTFAGGVSAVATSMGALFVATLPVVAPLLVVGGLVAAYQNNWGGFRDKVDELGVSIRKLAADLDNKLRPALEKVAPLMRTVFPTHSTPQENAKSFVEKFASKGKLPGASPWGTGSMGAIYANQRSVPFRDSGGKVQPHKLFASGVPELFVPQTAGNAYPLSSGNWQPMMSGEPRGASGARNVYVTVTIADKNLFYDQLVEILEAELR